MAISVAIGLKTVFCVLGCVMVATLIYTLSIDGLPFRKDLLTPWMVATLIDFYINVIAIGAWVSYKESNWISASLWVVLLVCFGSITTCSYIVLQLLKLSIGESSEDPIYYVLMRRPNKDGMEHKRRFSVVTTRIIFTALGFLMLATLLYTLLTDGSPFRTELLTPERENKLQAFCPSGSVWSPLSPLCHMVAMKLPNHSELENTTLERSF